MRIEASAPCIRLVNSLAKDMRFVSMKARSRCTSGCLRKLARLRTAKANGEKENLLSASLSPPLFALSGTLSQDPTRHRNIVSDCVGGSVDGFLTPARGKRGASKTNCSRVHVLQSSTSTFFSLSSNPACDSVRGDCVSTTSRGCAEDRRANTLRRCTLACRSQFCWECNFESDRLRSQYVSVHA